MHESEVNPTPYDTKKFSTPEEVKESIEKRVEKLITFEEFMREGNLSCVDGREQGEIVGTPGGTAGEFLLMLAAFEEARGETIQLSEVQAILKRYLEKVPRFYLHTDTHALHHLEEKYGDIDIQTGKGAHKEALLEALSQPEHIGCGHLKYMILQGKENYHIRPELVQESIKALYRLKWEGEKKIDLVIIEGDHQEGAVVVVTVEGNITPETNLPLVKPNTKEGGQVFMYHPQAAAFAREEIVKNIASIIGEEVDTDQFNEALENLSDAQLNATLGNLASGKPVYTALFRQDGELIEVTDDK